MSGAQAKQIKVTIGADEASFRRAQRLVRDFTSDVQKLVTAVTGLNQALGGRGGGLGGSGGMSVGNSPTMPGAGGAAAVAQHAASRAMQGPGGLLTKQLLDNKQLFAAIAQGSTSTLKTMSNVLRDEVGKQQLHIKALKKEIEGLAAAYESAKSAKVGPLANPQARASALQTLLDRQQELGQATEQRDRAYSRWEEIRPRSRWEKLKNEGGQFIERHAQAAGIGPTMMSAGGWAVAGFVIGKAVVGAMRSGMGEAEQAPYDFIGRAQKQGGSYGQAAIGLKHGDMSLMHAYRLMRSNDQFSKDFDALSKGDGSTSGFSRGTSGGIAFDQEGHRKDAGILRGLWNNKLNPVGMINDTKRNLDNIPVDMTVDQLRYLQGLKEASPLYFEARDQLYQNAGSDVGAMNAVGIGARKYKAGLTLDRVTGEFSSGAQVNSGLRTLRRATDTGLFQQGDLISAFKGIEAVGGREAGHRGMFSTMYGAAGGLYNAGGIYGTAAMTGDAGLFWRHLQNSVGRGSGGMDVGAANRMGGTLSGAMMSGMAPTSGLGLMGAMTAYGRGSSGARDMMIQSFMPQGLGAMGAVTAGRVDPYQSGSNLLNAIHAAPGASIFAQEYLAQLDPRVMFDVLGSGKVPKELEARGITFDMVKSYADKTMQRTYDRNIGMSPMQDSMDPMQQQAHSVTNQFGGDFKAYFDAGRKGLKGKELAAFEERAFTQRGAYLQSVGLADTDMTGQTFARLEAGRGRFGSGPFVAGRGAGPAAAGSNEALDMAERSKEQGQLERVRESQAAQIRGDIQTRGSAGAAGKMGEVGNEIGASAQRAAVAFDSLARAAENAANALNKAAHKAGAR